MSPCTTVLTVLPVALSRMEQRIFDAALKLSQEQRRTLRYRHYEEGSPLAPDLVVVANGDEALDRRLANYFGSTDRAVLPLVELNGNSVVATSADTRQSSTPFGILECLDATAREFADVCAPVQLSGFAILTPEQRLELMSAPVAAETACA